MRHVARQPILDLRGKVHGYELLFREGPRAVFSGDGDWASCDQIAESQGLSTNDLQVCYQEAIEWAEEALRSL